MCSQWGWRVQEKGENCFTGSDLCGAFLLHESIQVPL